METSEKIRIDSESFENVANMLKSASVEDASTALMAMEQMDFRKGCMFFAILFRDSLGKVELWKKHAPDLLKNIQGLGLDEICSYRSIWNKLKDKASLDEKKVFAKRFGIDATEILADWGFKDMIKDFKITISLKDDK
jgi:hypothetical protein